MWPFSNKEQYKGYNIYSMKKYVDKKRIIFNIIVTILTIITLMMVIYYTVDTSIRVKRGKQYATQIIEHQRQIQEQRRLEAERQAKIPKLTEVGKQNLKNIYHNENKNGRR